MVYSVYDFRWLNSNFVLFTGDYETVVSGNRMAIEPAVKSAVAQVAGVRPIRITNIHVGILSYTQYK